MPKCNNTHDDRYDLARTYGSGSFKKRSWTQKDGTVRTKWNGYVYASDGKMCYGSGQTSKAAEKAAQKARDKYEQSSLATPTITAPAPSMTLREFIYDVHFPACRTINRKRQTKRKYLDLAGHLCDWVPIAGGVKLGDRPIKEVKYAQLEERLNSFLQRERKGDFDDGDNYAADFLTFLRAVYRRAFNHEKVDRNYADALPGVSRPKKRALNISDSDIKKLFEMADDPRLRAYLTIGYMGVGISELLGLTADSIVGNTIQIRQQASRMDNPRFEKSKPVSPRKNPKSIATLSNHLKRSSRRRSIQLDDATIKVVMNSLDLAKTTEFWVEGEGYKSVLAVIPNQSGAPWQAHDFRRAWNKLCKKAKVKMTPHQFRALVARDSVKDGESLETVRALLGHSQTTTTERSYVRYADDDIPAGALSLKRSGRLTELLSQHSG